MEELRNSAGHHAIPHRRPLRWKDRGRWKLQDIDRYSAGGDRRRSGAFFSSAGCGRPPGGQLSWTCLREAWPTSSTASAAGDQRLAAKWNREEFESLLHRNLRGLSPGQKVPWA